MHMIPSDDYIKSVLYKIIPGDIVEINGYLVAVSHADGFNWNSSLTRNDSGQGACEVVWIDRLSVN